MKSLKNHEVFGKARANELLKFSIGVLKGNHGWHLKCQRGSRLAIAISIADRLSEDGFWWQAKTLRSWIHRCQRGDFDVEIHVRLKFTAAKQLTSLEGERGDS